MSKGELAYLILVIAGMIIFAATLAWVSRRPREGAQASRRALPTTASSPSRASHAH